MTAFLLISIGIIWALISAAILLSVAVHSSRLSRAEEMAARRISFSVDASRTESSFEPAARSQSVEVVQ